MAVVVRKSRIAEAVVAIVVIQVTDFILVVTTILKGALAAVWMLAPSGSYSSLPVDTPAVCSWVYSGTLIYCSRK